MISIERYGKIPTTTAMMTTLNLHEFESTHLIQWNQSNKNIAMNLLTCESSEKELS